MTKSGLISVDELIFNLVNASEGIEDFEFKYDNVRIIHQGDMIDKIDNDTILEFLRCPETKVFIKLSESGRTAAKLIAHNFISNETIEISNIGDHIIAMNEVLFLASAKRKELKENPNANIISNEMIENINALLLRRRLGEIGIGAYRDMNFFDEPCHVMIASLEHGRLVPIKEWQPEPGGYGRIPKKMDELVKWTNSEEFRNMEPLLRAAMFHAKFIKIHPFMDGNGRTGRMILNYMLLISGKPLTNITAADSEEYFKANAEAITKDNYQPLIDIIKKNQIRHGRELYSAIMRYHKERDRTMALNACQVDDLNV